MSTEKRESGFEYDGVFYEWHATDKGKDLMLVDRLTGMPPHVFFQAIQDDFDQQRGPVLLALMATSIRHRQQDWSLERILRLIDDISLTEVEFIDGDEDTPEAPRPPDEGAASQEPSAKSSDSSEETEDQPLSERSSASPA